MKKRILATLAIFSFLFIGSFLHAADQIYINVGQAGVKKSLLALTPLQYFGTQGGNPAHIRAAQELYAVIFNDLSASNFFTFIKPEAYLEDPNKVGLKPAPGTANGFNFQNWKTIGTEFLVRGGYQVAGNTLELEIYVYHVPEAKLVMGKNYKASLTGLRRLAHTFDNDLIKALTGKSGMFNSKIVASRQERGKDPKDKLSEKEIYIMDWDGNNPQKITSHRSIAVSPAWSNKGDKIAYTAFAYHKSQKVRNADLFIYNIADGKRFLVSYRKGINSGANFLPSDQQLLLTLSQEGSPDIFRMNADGTNLTQLTRGPNRSMNVEPAVSPDGNTIAFSSDRTGNASIYLMNADGKNPRRIPLPGKYNATPAWSPDGKNIAFAGYDANHFDVFVMKSDGSDVRRLTDAEKPGGKRSNNESPSWSPDGRHIAFASDRTGVYQIYMVNPDGANERRLTNDSHNWDKPKWSPFLD
jgi:TolB protein